MTLHQLRKGSQNSTFRLVLALGLAIALLVPMTLTASAQNLQPGGSSCVEGIVIDWQENPIEEGWFVRATAYQQGDEPGSPTGAVVDVLPSEDDDKEGQFEIEDDPHLIAEDWRFEIFFAEGADNAPEGIDYLVGDWRGVTPTAFDVTLDTTSHKCTRVRFKLKEIVTVLVTKIDADHNLLPDWTIYATPDKSNKFAYKLDGDTDENGAVLFEVTPGKWIFTEQSPDDVGDDYYPVIPADGQQMLNVESAQDRADDDDPGNDYVPELIDYPLRFKNEVGLGGCIQVLKTDLAPEEAQFNANFPLAGWEISILRADGTEETFGYTDATGVIKFEKLPPGPYTVQEETRVGWSLVDELVEDEIYVDYEQALNSSVSVTVTDNGCILIKFINEQSDAGYTIKGRKVDANGHYGIPGWTISATPLDKGGLEVDDVITDGSGYYEFELPGDDYRIPGARYEICEDDDVDGWDSVSATCYTVTIPKTLGSTATVPDFVNKQVGHPSGGGSSSSWTPSKSSWSNGNMNMGPMKGGMGGPPMMRPPMGKR